MTHAELVERAERWLRNTIRCTVVLAEPSGSGMEIPDAIGWQGAYPTCSVLIECKATRSDFLADRRKPYRHPLWPSAAGHWRWYMAPPGIIRADELPARWGLLEVGPRSVRKVVKAKPWKLEREGYVCRQRAETAILLSELRKFQAVAAGRDLMPSKAGRRVMDTVAAMNAVVS